MVIPQKSVVFFTSHYNDPRDMDAVDFLCYCPDKGILQIEDSEEWQLVQKKADWRTGEDNHLATLWELPVPVHRIPRTYINEILTKYAGITVEEMHTDWLMEAMYIPETDCFYTFSSDFGPGTFTPRYGEITDDIVTLWEVTSSGDGPDRILRLQKSGENWHILSYNVVPIQTLISDAQKAHRPQKSVRFCALFLLESTEKGCVRGGEVDNALNEKHPRSIVLQRIWGIQVLRQITNYRIDFS